MESNINEEQITEGVNKRELLEVLITYVHVPGGAGDTYLSLVAHRKEANLSNLLPSNFLLSELTKVAMPASKDYIAK